MRRRYEEMDGDAGALAAVEMMDPALLYNDVRTDPAFAAFVIPETALERKSIIAKGGFGIVYLATLSPTPAVPEITAPTPVAMKRLLPARMDDVRCMDDFMDEIRIGARLRHRHVVRFYGFSHTTLANLSIITEYMELGDLWQWLRVQSLNDEPLGWQLERRAAMHFQPHFLHRPPATLPPPPVSKFRFLCDIVQGLLYLHTLDPPMVHRDLKAKNVLLSATLTAKLTDFGVARETIDATMTAEIGTVAWIAPEILKGVYYTEKADVYSLGVLISEMDTLEIPYSNVDEIFNGQEPFNVGAAKARIAMLVVGGEITPTFSSEIPSCIAQLARRCLAYEPSQRPTIRDVWAWCQQIQEAPPDASQGDLFCVLLPNGTYLNAANATAQANEYRLTGLRGTGPYSSPPLPYLEALPTKYSEVAIQNVGLERLNQRLDANRVAPARTVRLDLSNNAIRSVANVTFPASLQALVLSNNSLPSVEGFSAPALESLSVSGNPLVVVPPLATLFPNLVEVKLNRLDLTAYPTAAVPATTQRLSLASNALTEMPSELPPGLRTLNLQSNKIASVRLNLTAESQLLCLGGNPITALYATRAQFDLLNKLAHPHVVGPNASPGRCTSQTPLVSAATTADDCRGRFVVRRLWGAIPVCVVESYASIELPAASPISRTAWLAVGGAFAFVVLLVVVGFVCCRRPRDSGKLRLLLELGDHGPQAMADLVNDVRRDPIYAPFRIPPEQLTPTRVLARGGFGVVFAATWVTGGGTVAVAMKRLLATKLDDVLCVADFMEEIRLSARLYHRNVVQFLGFTYTTLANLSIVTEFMAHGDLWHFLLDHDYVWHVDKLVAFDGSKRRMRSALSSSRSTLVSEDGSILRPDDAPATKFSFLCDIVQGLVYLHTLDPPVIHRDLKARNVLVDGDLTAKLTDFGVARETVDVTMTAEVGTVAWIAPEVLKGLFYDEKADVYSLGVVMSEMDTLEMPYAHLDGDVSSLKTRIALLVASGELAPRFTRDMPESLRAIADRCLLHDPAERPCIQDVWAWCRQLLPNLAGAGIRSLDRDLRKTCGLDVVTNTLDLSYNNLTSISGVQFPSQLLFLSVEHNQLRTFGDLSSLHRVNSVSLAHNELTALPLNGTVFPASIQALDLSFNRLGNDLAGLVTLPKLNILNLSHNAIWSVEGLDINYGTVVDLSGNKLTAVRNVSWPDEIKELYLQDNPLEEFYAMFYQPLKTLCFGKTPPRRFSATASQLRRLQSMAKSTTCPPEAPLRPLPDPCDGGPSARLWDAYTVCIVQDEALDARMDGDITSAPPASGNDSTVLCVAIALIAVTIIGLGIGAYWQLRRRRRWDKEALWLHPERAATGSSDFHEHVPHDIRTDARYTQFVIPHTDLTLQQVIAYGGFGIVYAGQLRLVGPVAIKRILPERYKHDKYAVEDFMDEIRLCLRLTHPHIVRCLGFSFSDALPTLSCVLEYMPHGDLWTLLELDHDSRLLSWNVHPTKPRAEAHIVDPQLPLSKLRVLQDVVAAMVYVHEQDIIHRDLKARNVLLSDTFESKVTDFGTSRQSSEEETMTAEIGTVAWIAPEVLKGVRYTAKADVYSLGVFMAEMDTLEVPYSNMPRLVPRTGVSVEVAKTRIAMLVVAGDLTPVFTADCPHSILEIARKCLAYDPEDRPSMADVQTRQTSGMASDSIAYKPLTGRVVNASDAERVNRTTFTTRCDACDFTDFRKVTWRTNVDDTTCIWAPNGTCFIGVNLNENDIPVSDWPGVGIGLTDKKSTQFLMGTGTEVSHVGGLSSVVSYITLFRLGIETLDLDLTSNKRPVPYNRAVEATQLNFSDNHIRSIDRVMTSDQTFNLFVDRNWIETVGDISTMKELRILNLNANRLGSINATVWPSKLDTLFLDHNHIPSLPPTIGASLRRLSILSIANNSLSSVDGVTFGDNLNTLNLAQNALTRFTNVGLPASLTGLHLQSNNLALINASSLPRSLVDLCVRGNPRLRFTGSDDDLAFLQRLNHSDPRCNDIGDAVPSGGACPEPGATAKVLWGRYSFCVLPPPAAAHSGSGALTVALGIFCALALVIGAGVFYEMRRRRQRYEQEQARSWQYSSSPNFPSLIADSAHLINDLRFDPEYQRYRIPAERIVRDRVLARGGFGVVYLATLTTEKGRQMHVAVKRMLPERLRSLRSIEDFMEEIRFCVRLQHPHIVEFIGYSWTTLPNLSVVTEYMSEGDLWTLLDTDHDAQSLPWAVDDDKGTAMLQPPAFSKLRVLVDILKALVYLHAQDVIHRDLKAKNVMLNEAFVAKLTDFGTSRETSEETMTSEIGTVAWIAPEVLKGVRYTEKADMYSLGVLISEMDMMEVPYSNIHRLLPESCLGVELAKTRIAMLVVAGELRPVFSTDCPAPILHVARRCLAYLPEDRPTAREVLSWLSPE
ncbi:protein kinase [Achlya hypogyna]|uniref:Protein kinase n=1 Tax=Achlya hypogyna TaxID=1202772 RepID=A0A1V9ZGB0_ACHHY|nr:protein kinase [Achlya hypogyna]